MYDRLLEEKKRQLVEMDLRPAVSIGDFGVACRLCFKASPSAKPYENMEISFIHM